MENLIKRDGMGGNLLNEEGIEEERRVLEAVMGVKCNVVLRRSRGYLAFNIAAESAMYVDRRTLSSFLSSLIEKKKKSLPPL